MANRYVPVLQEHAPTPLFDLDKLVDEWGVLTIHLLDTNERRFSLTFDDYFAYRKRDGGAALKTLNDAAGVLGKSFYRVEESDFLAWFEADSYGTRGKPLMHFVIMTIDDVIDVICRKLPVVAFDGGS